MYFRCLHAVVIAREQNCCVHNACYFIDIIHRFVRIFSFKKLCIKGYRILRRQYRQIVCLFKLMMNCDLTELTVKLTCLIFGKRLLSILEQMNKKHAIDSNKFLWNLISQMLKHVSIGYFMHCITLSHRLADMIELIRKKTNKIE
jgi:hypothetical protein